MLCIINTNIICYVYSMYIIYKNSNNSKAIQYKSSRYDNIGNIVNGDSNGRGSINEK